MVLSANMLDGSTPRWCWESPSPLRAPGGQWHRAHAAVLASAGELPAAERRRVRVHADFTRLWLVHGPGRRAHAEPRLRVKRPEESRKPGIVQTGVLPFDSGRLAFSGPGARRPGARSARVAALARRVRDRLPRARSRPRL
jgi:hypothetical protein